jgi:hypothetical protein
VRSGGEDAFTAVVNGRKRCASHFAEQAGELIGEQRRGDRDKFRVVAFDLREEFVQVGTCGEGRDFESIAHGFNNGESLTADGASGTEDGEVFHGMVYALSVAIRISEITDRILEVESLRIG